MRQSQARNRAKLRKLEEQHVRQRNLSTYGALVALAVTDGEVSPEESKAIKAFRLAHGITDAQHEEALRQVGWEGSEFA